MQDKIDFNKLMKDWGPILENDGSNAITNTRVKKSTAVMLQNQWNFMAEKGYVSEAVDTNTGLNRAGGYGTSGDFHKIAIPMVRRTFPELIAHDTVGVQPMTGPVGIAFALRFKAGDATRNYDGSTNVEVGYNTIDPNYSGSFVTSAGEQLGSYTPNTGTARPATGVGLGIGDGTPIPEVNLSIEKQQVEAKTRKLRSRWSLEVAQDIRAMHGLDLEEEMMDMLAYEITAEVDREIISAVRTAANNNPDSNVPGQLGSLTWSNSADFDGRWEAERYRNLYNNVVRKSNKIAVSTRRGPGNFVVADPIVCAALEGTSSYTIAPVAGDVNTAITGIGKIGSLDGRMSLIRDTFATTQEFTVGYKGNSNYDSGIIYLPYISLMGSKVTDNDSFNPSVGIMSRYGLLSNSFGAEHYYNRTIINGMP